MKPLLQKMGWKPGLDGAIHDAPEALADLFAAVGPAPGAPRWALWFAPTIARAEAIAPLADAAYQDGGHLWVAYPKKSGAIATDITRDRGWDGFGARDLLGVTQVAIDADWSALRFRRRGEFKTLTRRF
jgi:hypothetical protein